MITISWDHLTIHFEKCDLKEWLSVDDKRQADKPRQFDEEGEQNESD